MMQAGPLRAVRGTEPPAGTLGAVADLVAALQTAGVRYCHWKSNDQLVRSLTGENDLDLLVHPASGPAFSDVLDRLGFRRAVAGRGREHRGVTHHYAVDPATGRFAHVHAHLALVVGDDTTKDVELPFAAAYVDSASLSSAALPVPAPEMELLVFVLRMHLKHGRWDARATARGSLRPAERAELGWLLARAELPGTLELAGELLPDWPPGLWGRCVEALQGPGSLSPALGAEVRRHLRPHARRTPQVETWLRLGRTVLWGTRRHVLGIRGRKTLESGGASVAVVGGDAARRAAVAHELTGWLGGVLAVRGADRGAEAGSRTRRARRTGLRRASGEVIVHTGGAGPDDVVVQLGPSVAVTPGGRCVVVQPSDAPPLVSGAVRQEIWALL